MFFLTVSILALLILGGWYYLTLDKRPVSEVVDGVPNVPQDSAGDEADSNGENGENEDEETEE